MKIYTKTGDNGTTSLIGGVRISKDHPKIELLGMIDELNSMLGMIVSIAKNEKKEQDNVKNKYDSNAQIVSERLINVQRQLMKISSRIAGLAKSRDEAQNDILLRVKVQNLEKEIDEMTSEMPELHEFILPGGCKTAGMIYFARALCRKIERVAVKTNLDTLPYFNRLGDWLFTLARYMNFKSGVNEVMLKEK